MTTCWAPFSGFTGAGGYGDGGYDAAYDDEYPEQKPYPHPGELEILLNLTLDINFRSLIWLNLTILV